MKYLMIMWGGALVYLVVGIYAINNKKTPVRFSFTSRLTEDMVSDVAAYNHAAGKMWCVLAGVLFVGGVIDAWNPVFSVFIFAAFCIIGTGGIAWWQSKIEERFIEK